MPTLFQLMPLPLEVIDFAVDDNVERVVFIGDGFVAGREVDDAQPGMPQAHSTVGGVPNAQVVRPAMDEAFGRLLQGVLGDWFRSRKEGNDATH